MPAKEEEGNCFSATGLCSAETPRKYEERVLCRRKGLRPPRAQDIFGDKEMQMAREDFGRFQSCSVVVVTLTPPLCTFKTPFLKTLSSWRLLENDLCLRVVSLRTATKQELEDLVLFGFC